jgi:hypothetical protein
MNHTITNPKGIDKEVQKIQTDIFNKIGWENIDVFGRVHRNPSKGKGLVPEAYKGSNEYQDIYTNDHRNATICFLDDSSHKADGFGYYKAEVKVIFSVNLKKINPNASHRNDVDAQIEALKIIERHKIFKVTGIEKGIDTIFKGFDVTEIKLTDMQPFHMFAIVGELKYRIINC